MTNEEKILTLNPDDQPKFRLFMKKGDEYLATTKDYAAFKLLIAQARRTIEYQAGLFSVGRKWDGVNRKWEVVGEVLTHTMNSRHLEGKAIDCGLWDGKKLLYPDPKTKDGLTLWLSLAEIARQIGLYPGSLWTVTKPDYDHFASEPG